MDHVSAVLGLSTLAIEKILDFLPYPFLVSEWRDGNQRNLFVNKAFVEEIGFTCKEIPTITDWFEKAYPEKDYRNQIMYEWEATRRHTLEKGLDSVVVKARISTKNKGLQWYEVKASVAGLVNLVAFVNINEEITKEIQLSQLNEDKNRVLSILTHDLRAPLGSLNGLISLSTDGILSQSEFNQCVKKIATSTFNLIEFLDTTLIWARSNFEGINTKVAEVYLPEMVNRTCALYEKTCQEKRIGIRLNFPVRQVDTDPEILSIVLRNVLSNAIKFTADGEIAISSFLNTDGHPVLSVRDSGMGIPEVQLRSIRNGLSKSTEGTHQEKGFGLGLRLCTDMLMKIGGQITVDSILNEGTLVEIVLAKPTDIEAGG